MYYKGKQELISFPGLLVVHPVTNRFAFVGLRSSSGCVISPDSHPNQLRPPMHCRRGGAAILLNLLGLSCLAGVSQNTKLVVRRIVIDLVGLGGVCVSRKNNDEILVTTFEEVEVRDRYSQRYFTLDLVSTSLNVVKKCNEE